MKTISTLFTLALLMIASGCGSSASPEATSVTDASIDGKQYLLREEPDGAIGVIAARENSEDGKPLILVGRIGGTANPWIEGRAAFTLLDASMSVVAEGEESENAICTESCCDELRVGCTALVKLVDGQGAVIPVDSRQLLGLKESDMLVVEGKAQKDKAGNFVMIANRVYVRR